MGIVTSCFRDAADAVEHEAPEEHALGQLGTDFHRQAGQGSGSLGVGLTQAERGALLDWEQNGRRINTEIDRSPDPSRPAGSSIPVLDSAVSKLPPFQGVAYKNHGFRGGTAGLSSFTPRDAALRYTPGMEYTSPHYTSFTTDATASAGELRRYGTDVVVAMKTSRAVDLAPATTMAGQAEVLLPRNSKWTTTHVQTNPVQGPRAQPNEQRTMVLAHTPNSSPVSESGVSPVWLEYARGGDPLAEPEDNASEMSFGRRSESP